MADLDVPDKFSVAIRVILWVVCVFIFGLVGWEKFWEGQYVVTGVNGGLLVLATIVAVKWHQLARFLGRRKVTLLYMGIAMVCALGLGFSIAKLMGRTLDGQTTIITPAGSDTGRIAWNLEESARGLNYFLGFNRQNQEELHISGFVAHGRNTSNDPITQFKGYIRSDITNEQMPIYLLAEDPNAKDIFGSRIPTLPEETFGIPASAEFDITTFNKAVFEGGKDGIPISKFMKDFASFTLVLEYDGIVVRRQFTQKEIQGQLDFFERQIDPRKSGAPRVTRRPNATPPIQPAFEFPIAPQAKPKG